jgi:hypothetical protein
MILKCLEFLYEEEAIYNEAGVPVDVKSKPIRVGFVTKLDVHPTDIIAFKQAYNNKGMIYKNRCIISHHTLGNLIVNHSFEELTRLKQQATPVIKGFYGK